MTTYKTLRQIDDELPNGFHDALLQTINLDLVSKVARLSLQMSVGEPEGITDEASDGYKPATLTLEDLVYFVIETPDLNKKFLASRGVSIDAGDATNLDNPRAPRPLGALPDDAFAYWFFVHEWNCFIHVAARRASLEWKEDR